MCIVYVGLPCLASLQSAPLLLDSEAAQSGLQLGMHGGLEDVQLGYVEVMG